ncbi:superfamily I DNA/RNA helicase [Streptomonospora nanhaiensis]|uniref:DNA 3'-5' helicase n=1 Tax=Streptomonospora nanhaiensis TaxID=1323731 RepID=A0A853BJP3_9ACTN|nr:DEAD/DEAH box helicase [Streptomonospora nanhaiensis]NYI95728.1 superfamily I DNA/RNA helicase [Streptomonospora nanhaiensis]
MPQLAIDATCLPQYDKLDKPTRERLLAATRKFRELSLDALLAHPDLRIRSLPKGQDPRIRTFRISDSWTGVMLAPESGETFLLVHLLPRDTAEDWATDQRHDVNPVMGTLERRDATALGQAAERAPAHAAGPAARAAPVPTGSPGAPARAPGPARTAPAAPSGAGATAPAAAPPAAPAAPPLFDHVSDHDLQRLGIDPEIRDFCRTLTTARELHDWAPALPQDQFEVLRALADGHSVQRVRDEVVVPRRPVVGAVAADDYDTAIRHTRERVIVVNDNQEIEDVLAGEFNAWRVFLHPKQRDLAYRPRFNGPAKVSGGPGTGKTVVALHRVKYLAEHLPLGGRVLLTSFTNALVESLKRNLALLIPPELVEDVDVVTTDKLALDVVKEVHPDIRLRTDTRGVFANYARQHRLPWPVDFLFSEYRHVITARGITTLEGYLDPDARAGRTTPLNADQRRRVWHAVSSVRAMMRTSRKLPAEDLHAEAARILSERAELPYTNVVVDEAQDLHPAQWRTLRAAVPPGPNDLFIAGDNRQRIYDNTVSFKQLGIEIVGRSYPLRVNYRTTEQILTWADGILRGQPVLELGDSAAIEPGGSTRCVLSGPPPELYGAPDEPTELDALAERVRGWLAEGIEPADICVTARTNKLRDSVAAHLRARALPAAIFNPREHSVTDTAHAVRVTTMHGVKGLEFRAIAVFAATADALPQTDHLTDPALDENQRRAELDAQRSLLYVACTRARERLYVSWHGAPSPFLPL